MQSESGNHDSVDPSSPRYADSLDEAEVGANSSGKGKLPALDFQRPFAVVDKSRKPSSGNELLTKRNDDVTPMAQLVPDPITVVPAAEMLAGKAGMDPDAPAEGRPIDGVPAGRDGSDNLDVWHTYVTKADEYDKILISGWKEGIDVFLLFTGLFSAILSAFLVAALPALQTDSGEATVAGLAALSRQLAASGAQQNNMSLVFEPPSFSIPTSALWVNGLWFTSLSLSLFAAVVAMLVKEWIYAYTNDLATAPLDRARQRQFRYEGINKWHLPGIVSFLPICIHIAVFLFFAGLAAFVWSVNLPLAAWIIGQLGLAAVAYIASAVLPMVYSDCPYKSPLYYFLAIAKQVYLRADPLRSFLRVLKRDDRPIISYTRSAEVQKIEEKEAALESLALGWLATSTDREVQEAALMHLAVKKPPNDVWPRIKEKVVTAASLVLRSRIFSVEREMVVKGLLKEHATNITAIVELLPRYDQAICWAFDQLVRNAWTSSPVEMESNIHQLVGALKLLISSQDQSLLHFIDTNLDGPVLGQCILFNRMQHHGLRSFPLRDRRDYLFRLTTMIIDTTNIPHQLICAFLSMILMQDPSIVTVEPTTLDSDLSWRPGELWDAQPGRLMIECLKKCFGHKDITSEATTKPEPAPPSALQPESELPIAVDHANKDFPTMNLDEDAAVAGPAMSTNAPVTYLSHLYTVCINILVNNSKAFGVTDRLAMLDMLSTRYFANRAYEGFDELLNEGGTLESGPSSNLLSHAGIHKAIVALGSFDEHYVPLFQSQSATLSWLRHIDAMHVSDATLSRACFWLFFDEDTQEYQDLCTSFLHEGSFARLVKRVTAINRPHAYLGLLSITSACVWPIRDSTDQSGALIIEAGWLFSMENAGLECLPESDYWMHKAIMMLDYTLRGLVAGHEEEVVTSGFLKRLQEWLKGVDRYGLWMEDKHREDMTRMDALCTNIHERWPQQATVMSEEDPNPLSDSQTDPPPSSIPLHTTHLSTSTSPDTGPAVAQAGSEDTTVNIVLPPETQRLDSTRGRGVDRGTSIAG